MFKKSFKYKDDNLSLTFNECLKKKGGYKKMIKITTKNKRTFFRKPTEKNGKKFYKILACICWSFIPIYIAVYLFLAKEIKILNLIMLLMIPFFAGAVSIIIPIIGISQSINLLLKFVDFAKEILTDFI